MSASTFIPDVPIDNALPVRVICIGAGASGICTGVQFPRKIKNLELQIYEKNPDIGGTWYENRYPGVACDLPSASYQFSFENNTQWSEFYSSGGEIEQYFKDVARKYEVEKYVKLNHAVVGARWNEESATWTVDVHDTVKNIVFRDEAHFVVASTGVLNKWAWPSIPGLDSFKGNLLHSANWDDSVSLDGKTVALIGGGSSAIQILPAIQKKAKFIANYVRGRMWIMPGGLAGPEAYKRNPDGGNSKYTEEELAAFKRNPEDYMNYRKYIEHLLNTVHTSTFAGSEAAILTRSTIETSMKDKLAKKPWIYEALRPDYPPICRRLTPGPGYLEALVEDNVEFVPVPIKSVVPDGIVTEDGTFRQADILITATGFDTTFTPRYPVIGREGESLEKIWEEPYPEAYLAMFAQKMPNYMMILGPNGTPPTGSMLLAIENQVDYIIQTINKCQREGYKSVEIKLEALKSFSAFIDEYMKRTVYVDNCKSWFKRGMSSGRVVALFPGSSLAFRELLLHPRWEDFNFEKYDYAKINPMAWIGNGMTYGEMTQTDTTPYLKIEDVALMRL